MIDSNTLIPTAITDRSVFDADDSSVDVGAAEELSHATIVDRLVFWGRIKGTGVEAHPASASKPTVLRTFSVTVTEASLFCCNLATVTLPPGPVYRATVFWGNGRTSSGTLTRLTPTGMTYTVSSEHSYADPGEYIVLVRVTADSRTVLSIELTATVIDNRFYVGRVAQGVTASKPFSGVVATIQDMNPKCGHATDYSATIDWCDGRISEGVVRQVSTNRFEVTGTNTFTTAGTERVVARVRAVATGVTATAESIFVVTPPRR